MGLGEALELFTIADITQETDETLKKKYKKLMIKFHPDNYNGDENKAKDITSALEILKDAINNIRKLQALNTKNTQLNIIIPLYKLIDLYNGGKMTVGNDETKHEIDGKTIQKHNTLIISDVSITHNGITHNFNNIQRWSIDDNYEVNCEIFVTDIKAEENVTITINKTVKTVKFTSQSVVMKISLEHNVTVSIRITKKVINDST